ncbi:MAG: ABC-F family ATP-binding cassette domain-containing protein [Chitinispirillaceae bacterium]
MNIVSVDQISKSQGDKLLFEQATFGIQQSDKIALIGVNGSGKSSLLNLLTGADTPDSGTISLRKGLRIGRLDQLPRFCPTHTILEHVLCSDVPAARIVREYETVCKSMQKQTSPQLQQRLEQITARMDQLNAWSLESTVSSLLSELGIDETDIRMDALSGGMVKKVALAQLFINQSDLLLLDEPTNHLDIDTIEWLESKLQKTGAAVLMITHDRYILDSICTRILEIDNRRLYSFSGNYAFYLEKKAEIENSMAVEEQRVKTILKRELQWLGQTPQARATKQKARIQRVHEMMGSLNGGVQADMEFSISGRRLGKKILEAKHLAKSYDGTRIIEDFSHTFKRQERIGVVGPNGSGKTTLLNLLTQRVPTDTGSVEKGVNTHFGVFEQNSGQYQTEKTVLQTIRDIAEVVRMPDGSEITAGKLLERFLFPPAIHYTPVAKLSGGERRRLHLVRVLMGNPNFLVLDEPTNDLDIKTLSVLEDFLESFSGCLLVVSHDRYFMDRVVDFLFVLDGSGHIGEFPGSYSDYIQYKKEQNSEQRRLDRQQEQEKSRGQQKQSVAKRKLTFNEQRELERLEEEIESLEEEKTELDQRLGGSAPDGSPEQFARWGERYSEVEKLLEQKLSRWEELASFV